MPPLIPIYKELEALPERNLTTIALNTLDYLVPGQWQNIRSLEAMIVHTTGLTDQRQIQLIGERAIDLYADPANRFTQALKVYRVVDTVDKVVGLEYDAALNLLDSFESPHVIVEYEQFREFSVTEAGGVYQMALGDDGVSLLRWR